MVTSLDKWIFAPIKQNIEKEQQILFIDLPDIEELLTSFGKKIEANKYSKYLNKTFSKPKKTILYLGEFPKKELNNQESIRQSNYFRKLKKIGFSLKTSVKYLKNNSRIEIKGIEVLIGLDLIFLLKKNQDTNIKEKYIIICGDNRKYLRLVKFINEKFKKRIYVESLSQQYEEQNENFYKMLESITKNVKVGRNENWTPEKRYKSPLNKMTKIGTLCPQDMRSKIRYNKTLKKFEKDTFLVIDFGNVYHYVKFMRKRNLIPKMIKIEDILLLIKKRPKNGIKSSNRLYLWGCLD